LHHELRVIRFVFSQPGESLLEHRQIGDVVLGEFCRPQERRFGTPLAGNSGNLFIIGGNDYARHMLRLQRGGNAVSDQRCASKIADVLARNAL